MTNHFSFPYVCYVIRKRGIAHAFGTGRVRAATGRLLLVTDPYGTLWTPLSV